MRRVCTIGGLLVLLSLSLNARATTVLLVPIQEMARHSDLIIRARVANVRVVSRNRDPRQLWTEVKLRVVKVYKGYQTAPTLTLRLLGGHKGKWTLEVPGMPSFVRGSQVLLFLERTSGGYVPAGLSMGKFDLYRDEASGKWRARRDLSGVNALAPSVDGRLEPVRPTKALQEFDLDDLVRIIQESLREQGGAK